MTATERASVLARVAGLADDGLRVIAVAEGHDIGVPEDALHAEDELTFVGLAAFRDPSRRGARCGRCSPTRGVRTIVVSGDHPATVAATAREAGVVASEACMVARRSTRSTTTSSPSGSGARPSSPAPRPRTSCASSGSSRTAARSSPSPATASTTRRHSPRRRGIAMGARGTDLAREASDLVLVDDAYPTIVGAVAGGRGLASQLRRAVAFYLGRQDRARRGRRRAAGARAARPVPPGAHRHPGAVHGRRRVGGLRLRAAAPGAMDHPPRDPARRFLDDTQLSAISSPPRRSPPRCSPRSSSSMHGGAPTWRSRPRWPHGSSRTWRSRGACAPGRVCRGGATRRSPRGRSSPSRVPRRCR